MIVKNVKVYREDQTFADGEIRILDGVFEKVCTGAGRGEGILAEKDETVIDGDGAGGGTCADPFCGSRV